MSLVIDCVLIDCVDLDAMTEFWCQAINLEHVWTGPFGGHLLAASDGSERRLGWTPWQGEPHNPTTSTPPRPCKSVWPMTILSLLRPDVTAPYPGKDKLGQRERDKVQRDLKSLPQQELQRLILTLEAEMQEASAALKFEYAARPPIRRGCRGPR